MEKKQKIESFDVDGALNADNNIFGLPFDENEAMIILLPVPWDVTVSYKAGTSYAPENIKNAALQIEIFDSEYENAWHSGFFMHDLDKNISNKNKKFRPLAEKYIQSISSNNVITSEVLKNQIDILNNACSELNEWVEENAANILLKNKIVGIVGGDHSAPFGLVKALSKKHNSFSVLQIDAHADLRKAYEGFEYSHASIMHNVSQIENVKNLVQIGVRDYGSNERDAIISSRGRILTYFDAILRQKLLNQEKWDDLKAEIISHLDNNVYISFDIDGLSPELCPCTGTPVPGGLSFFEATSIINAVVKSGRKIIGFDLCEVGCSENNWDETVASRILYKLCGATAVSNGFI
ncbi:MAG: agmatinase family protein [Bacteroidales bacterium]|nr:agmatinase family protein [Bacteroidales bacterium]